MNDSGNKTFEFWVVAIALVVFGFGFVFGMVLGSEPYASMPSEAIERGYALYCPKNGQFAWKGECE